MIFNSGKNAKFPYYFRNVIRSLEPQWFFEKRLPQILGQAALREDYQEMCERVNYYCIGIYPICEQSDCLELPVGCPALSDIRVKKPKVYYYDTLEYTRYFPQRLRLSLAPGDAPDLRPWLTVTKCRPTIGDNSKGVLLNLDKVRHFISPRPYSVDF